MADSGRVLFWGSGSAPCWKVMIMLEEKGLPYESKLLEFGKGEHKGPEVMALNPRGQLPTFKDNDGTVVNDSLAAVLYLEDAYPEPSLVAPKTDMKARAAVWQRMAEALALYDKMTPAFYMKMRGQVKTEEDEKVFKEKAEAAQRELQIWENHFASGPKDGYAAGGTSFTVADVMLATTLMAARRFGATLSTLPNLKEYADRVEARPSLQKTWPPHWKTSPAQNWLAEYL